MKKQKQIFAEEATAALEILFMAAEQKKPGTELCNAVGEVTIRGRTYQIQLFLIEEKGNWISETDIVEYRTMTTAGSN
jgi:hypothetical protein